MPRLYLAHRHLGIELCLKMSHVRANQSRRLSLRVQSAQNGYEEIRACRYRAQVSTFIVLEDILTIVVYEVTLLNCQIAI
jgi:hypothetical protein